MTGPQQPDIVASPHLHHRVSLAVLAVLTLGPVIWLAAVRPGDLAYYAIGGAAWGLAVAGKLLLARVRFARRLMKAGVAGAGLWGLASGLAELGVLAAIASSGWLPLQLEVAAICGLGAAGFEIVFILVTGAIEDYRHPDPDKLARWLAGARRSLWVAYMGAIERIDATALHVMTRIAVFDAMIAQEWAPALAALGLFALVDGAATYGASRDWDWFEPRICRAFYLAISAAALAGWVYVALRLASG
ncbi:hypothetical protein [Aurantimonas coralicida]|uniref:hypothetical protein n=1 Tax=Aurantimonas coralicida TaxID=182270 RepID=UPI00239DE689|nr:hypothetical protein [Aurantimonas coralicida]MDE0922921.1 hypothetical protein [Aurantimonas coralicida]